MQGRTRSDDRGQTPQDFAVGISIFLLAVIAVFTFLPNVFTPFTSGAQGFDGQADRASTSVVDELAEEPGTTRLNESATERWFYTYDGRPDDVALTLGLQDYQNVNVTIYRLDGTDPGDVQSITANGNTTRLVAGHEYEGEASSTMVRIVRFEGACSTGCRMVVRVW
jgi:hypothetical protein